VTIARTEDSTGEMCVECGALVDQGWGRVHDEWHSKQNEMLSTMLRIATHAREDAARLRGTLLEMEGKAP
jgi:hypothetical protein